MSKWIRSLALAAAVAVGTAGLVTVSGTVAQGQGKAKEQPKPKVDPPKPAEAKGSVVIKQSPNDKKFRFQVRTEAGKTVMDSTVGYATAEEAIKAFEEALAIAKASKPVVEKAEK